MKKLIPVDGNFYNTMEPCIQVIDDDFMDSHVKLASEAWSFIKDVKPKQGHRYILVVAMGAGEYWGSNKNGDYFPEADLKKNYKHFETKFNAKGQIEGGALVFKHHKNKVANGDPWYGTVVKSFYNEEMHRVELLLDLHADKAQDIIDRVDAGDAIAVSMGVRIPYDICSKCGNKAKTRKQYCSHLLYQLNKVLPDGTKIYAINGNYDYKTHPTPLKFFDISIVFRPADQTGWMLKKVAFMVHEDGSLVGSAELYEKEASLQEKIALLRKLSEMDKIIKGIPVAYKNDKGDLRALESYKNTVTRVADKMQPLDDSKIDQLSEFPMNKVLATIKSKNMLLTTPEFLSIVFKKLTGRTLPAKAKKEISAKQGELMENLADNPEKIAAIENYDMFKEAYPDEKIASILEDIAENRDLSDSGFTKKATTDFMRSALDLQDPQFPWGDNKGMLHTETYTDPQGQQHAMNMSAMEDARVWDLVKKETLDIGGAALLLGLAAHLSSKHNPLSIPAAAAGLALGAKGVKDLVTTDDYLTTDQGTRFPKSTMLFEKKSAILPKLRKLTDKSDLAIAATMLPIGGAIAGKKYYENRLQDGTAGSWRTPLEKNMDQYGRLSYVHPVVSGLGGAVAGAAGLKGIRHLLHKISR